MVSEGNGDGAGADADVGYARRLKAGGKLEDFLDQVLGFRAGNKDIGRDAKEQAVELGLAGDVLDGLAPVAALEQLGITAGFAGGELFLGVGHEPDFVFAWRGAQDVKQQGFGILARAVRVWPEGQADCAA
jgi:hypothetical protein